MIETVVHEVIEDTMESAAAEVPWVQQELQDL
jgi:hypothetical protein